MISLIIEQSYCIGETVGIGIKLSNQIMLTLTHLKKSISIHQSKLSYNRLLIMIDLLLNPI